MAIPKKGSRLITVDGTGFRWRVRRKPTYCQGNSRGPMTLDLTPGATRRAGRARAWAQTA